MIATGGLATLFDKHTDMFDAVEPDLTIQGLSLLYDMAAQLTMTPGDELLFLRARRLGRDRHERQSLRLPGKWLMVDLGLTFADPDYPGIDLILPDLEFIEERRDDLVGIVLTHGHEDHIGAIPYLAADLKVPLYATPFTGGLIAGKLEEEGLTGQVELNVIERGGCDRPRAVPFRLRRARPLDSRRQRAADRNAARPHLPHRRLEDRRNASARRAVEPES